MAGMSDERTNRGGCSVIGIVCIGLALLPLLYILSAGPATTLLNHGWLSLEVGEVFFWPLQRAGSWFPSFHKLMAWYCQLWNW
jgi:hypothetical protein